MKGHTHGLRPKDVKDTDEVRSKMPDLLLPPTCLALDLEGKPKETKDSSYT